MTMTMLTIFLLLSAAFTLGDARDLNDTENQIIENLIRNLPIESEEMGAKEKGGLQTRSSSCPPGWHRYETHCYHYVPIMAKWPEAEHYCLLLGGNLASVHSLSQYNFLQSVIQSGANGAQRTWIGANDAIKVRSTLFNTPETYTEGLWLWSDGSRFSYQNWGKGQPDNYIHVAGNDNTNGHEHCMEMNFGGDFGQNDAVCWIQRPFMCSRKL
ncbi:galactose-specific lectin nattectin-like isoform X1 [Oncorhynchus tshawytscha]|uniref:galactose-specific lectin nattectin-like isoform X1 n=1 Tax=Oncorhynchus tshawytscha TaxID=74940 RepID=UPI001C3E6707|nr:galactose-specific lectin nattectin-like isoform X1 [Oncorhynchus tshawytscha]